MANRTKGPRPSAFKPGQSGNPGGRPKIAAELKELCRAYTAAAIKALASVLEDKEAKHSDTIAAACALLDRGYGRPTQHVQAEVTLFEGMSLDERYKLERAIAAISGSPGAAEGGEPQTHH